MAHPYFLMTVLYVSLAVLAAIDAALTGLNLLPWFNALRWLRVHFITLGILVEATFGLLPALVAARNERPAPTLRWDIWLTLNAGLVTLLIGIPLVNLALIFAGGALVFTATALLLWQLHQLRATPTRAALALLALLAFSAPSGRNFYLAGLGFLLFGVLFGTGLWLGWGEFLRAAAPKEIHLHANLWGFASLLFAGLTVDLYPRITGRALAWQRASTPIFWLFTLGGVSLIIGPWLGLIELTIPGLALHHIATAWLLLALIIPISRDRRAWTPGMWHIVASNVLILAPVVFAPFALRTGARLPLTALETAAPALLIYGWVLQNVYAFVPYLFARAFAPDQPARLGGTWLSVVAMQVGALLYVVSMVNESNQALLQAIAYALWAISALPIVRALWQILQRFEN